MNAFISYSIGNNEQYILNLLAQKVAETGLALVTSYNQSDLVSHQTSNDIKNSALFIGLITRLGRLGKTGRVYSEFKLANLFSRPAILLIEDNVEVAPWINNYQNTIKFNRHYINHSIEEVKNRINNSSSQPSPSTAAWVLGGIAVLGLLALLSDKDK